MLRRTPLKQTGSLRRAELKPSQSQMARTAMTRTPMKTRSRRRKTKPLLLALVGRSGGWCELQIADVCQGVASDPAHRNGSRSGGRHGDGALVNDRLSNVLAADRACHDWQTATAANLRQAKANGWVLRESDDPLMVPVLYRGGWVLLDDDSNVISCAPPTLEGAPL